MNPANKRLNFYYKISYLLGVICLFIIGYITYLSVQKTKEHFLSVDHTNRVIDITERLLTLMIDAETGVRGYHVSGKLSYLEPYYYSEDSTKVYFKYLKILTVDNPTQQKKIETLGKEIKNEFDLLREGIYYFRMGEKEKLNDLYYSGKDKQKMDFVRSTIKSVKDEELRLLNLRKTSLNNSREFTKTFIIFIILIYLVISIISYNIIHKYLSEKDKFESKLYETNQILASTLEELRVSNEEIVATNESLSDVNEKLAYSNEELAATTEEYQTAHDQAIIANEKLAEMNLDLEKRVESRVHELQEQNEILKKINNDLDDFVYTAAHDLKSPVNTMEGLINVLQLQSNGDLDENQKQTLKMMIGSSAKLKKTIFDLTQILRVQKEENLNKETIIFDEVFKEVCDDINDLIEKVKPHFIIDWKVEKLFYPHKHIRSILYNLISNALKYRSPDRDLIIRISTCMYDYRVELSVSDNGLGLDQKYVPKLFTMFKRFHDHVEGSGIGLYTVKRIIENNGGTIRVESNLETGTRFIILL